MALIYLSSVDGNDADDGLTWANAKTTWQAALTAAGAGGTVYVDSAHNETNATATHTITSPGTAASPTIVISVNRTGNPEPPTALLAGAAYTASAAGANVSFAGHAVVYGLSLIATGVASPWFSFNSATPWGWKFISSVIDLGGGSSFLYFGVPGGDDNHSVLHLVDTPIKFGSVSSSIVIQSGRFLWENTLNAIQDFVPTNLIVPVSYAYGAARIVGVDLSAAGSGKTLVDSNNLGYSRIEFIGCKLGSSVTLTSGAPTDPGGYVVEFVNCDSANTNYRYLLQSYEGTIVQETTIVRTGGATDLITPFSRKFVSSAGAGLHRRLRLDAAVQWINTTSAVTATCHIVTDGVTLTDKEAWLEVEYMGTSGFPQFVFANDAASLTNQFLGSGTNQATDTADWTTTGLASPTKQKLEVTFTPAHKGPARFVIVLAKASTTMYACPKIDIV